MNETKLKSKIVRLAKRLDKAFEEQSTSGDLVDQDVQELCCSVLELLDPKPTKFYVVCYEDMEDPVNRVFLATKKTRKGEKGSSYYWTSNQELAHEFEDEEKAKCNDTEPPEGYGIPEIRKGK